MLPTDVRTTFRGGLKCYEVVEKADRPDLAVVLCHGFGATGTDLVGLAPELLRTDNRFAENVRFVFPEAPLGLDTVGMPGGRAWWMLDIEQFNAAIQSGHVRVLREDCPDGLAEAREKLTRLVEDLIAECQLSLSQVILGGFSQGSMLATDVALRLQERVGALCVYSGTLLNEAEWRPLAAERGPLRVVQSHGQHDPILPFFASEWLHEMFQESGFETEFIPFPGVHTIPMEGIDAIAAVMRDLLND